MSHHPGTMTDEQRIQQKVSRFVEAYNAGDLAHICDIFADDVVDMSAGDVTRTGTAAKEHFRSRVAATLASNHAKLTIHTDETRVAGDWAYQRGSLVVELTSRGGGARSQTRQRYLEIWRRDSHGEWKAAIEMDNSEEK